jgi:hypothetical protein
MRQGWYGERHRHYLAAKGIKTTVQSKFYANKLNYPTSSRAKFDELSKKNVEYFNEMASAVGGMSYSESKEVTADMAQDYEALGVSPAQARLMAYSDLRKSQKAFEQTVMQSDDPDQYFSRKYFFLQESGPVKDDSGIFGAQHKEDSIKTNNKLEVAARKQRILTDQIEQGIKDGKYSEKAYDDILDRYRPIKESFVNNQLTRSQFDEEVDKLRTFYLQQHSKTASAFEWAPPANQQSVRNNQSSQQIQSFQGMPVKPLAPFDWNTQNQEVSKW